MRSALGLPMITARNTAHVVVAPPSVLSFTALKANPMSTIVASCRFKRLKHKIPHLFSEFFSVVALCFKEQLKIRSRSRSEESLSTSVFSFQ